MTKIIDRFKGEYEFLSNFYPAKITVDGRDYPTVEHYYQAAKTHDNAEHERVRTAPRPAQAKARGRRVTLRSDWETAKVLIMRNALRAKFAQNPTLGKMLMDTGRAELIEGNTWNDTYWGVSTKTGNGLNTLGRLLMEVRQELFDGVTG